MRKDVLRKQHNLELEAELLHNGVDLAPPPVIRKPETHASPSFSGYSGRLTRTEQHVQEKHLANPMERFTVLPWDQAKSKLGGKAVELGLPPKSTGGAGAGGARPSTTTAGGTKPILTQRSAITISTSDNLEEEEERWKSERTLLIQRMGLAGGTGAKRDRRKKQTQRGADFSSTASRAAPLWHQWHQVGIVSQDLMYTTSIAGTSRARVKSAEVRLGNYSSRNATTTRQPFVENTERILQFENLAKFHKQQKLNAKRSVFALPEDPVLEDDAPSSVMSPGGSRRKSTKSPQRGGSGAEEELSRVNDFSLHPETARAPLRGLYSSAMSSSPSLFFFSDRSDASIGHVLGGARQVTSASRRKPGNEAGGDGVTSSGYQQTQGSSPSLA